MPSQIFKPNQIVKPPRPQDQYKPFRDTQTSTRLADHSAEPTYASIEADLRHWNGPYGEGRDGLSHSFSRAGRFQHVLVSSSYTVPAHRINSTPDFYQGHSTRIGDAPCAVVMRRPRALPRANTSFVSTPPSVGPGTYSPFARPLTAGHAELTMSGYLRGSAAFASRSARSAFSGARRASEVAASSVERDWRSWHGEGPGARAKGSTFCRCPRFVDTYSLQRAAQVPGPGAYLGLAEYPPNGGSKRRISHPHRAGPMR
jgi:hypothetical protein